MFVAPNGGLQSVVFINQEIPLEFVGKSMWMSKSCAENKSS